MRTDFVGFLVATANEMLVLYSILRPSIPIDPAGAVSGSGVSPLS